MSIRFKILINKPYLYINQEKEKKITYILWACIDDIQRVSNNYKIKYINHNIRRKCKIEILEM